VGSPRSVGRHRDEQSSRRVYDLQRQLAGVAAAKHGKVLFPELRDEHHGTHDGHRGPEGAREARAARALQDVEGDRVPRRPHNLEEVLGNYAHKHHVQVADQLIGIAAPGFLTLELTIVFSHASGSFRRYISRCLPSRTAIWYPRGSMKAAARRGAGLQAADMDSADA